MPPENPAVLIPPLPEAPCETGAPLGKQGRFCRVFSGRAGAPHPSLVEANRLKASLCSVCPQARAHGRAAEYCSVPRTRAACPPAGAAREDALVGRCAGTCRIMGDRCGLKAAAVRAGLFPGWAFSGCFNPCSEGCRRKGCQVGLQDRVCSKREPDRGEWLLVYFLGRVKELFALEVIFWRVFTCTFLSAELRRHLIKSVVCQEQADCRGEGAVCVDLSRQCCRPGSGGPQALNPLGFLIITAL